MFILSLYDCQEAGVTEQIGDRQVYIVGSSPKCIIWCHDMKGFNADDRTRQLVDKLAETTGWTVVLPDFIGGHKVRSFACFLLSSTFFSC